MKNLGAELSFIRKIKRGNRIYLAEVENYRDGAKVKQRFIKYLGVDSESEKRDLPLYVRDISAESVKIYGPVIALESIARELGFYDVLGDLSKPILALTFSHCLGYRSVEETQKWFQETELPSLLNIEKMTTKILHSSLESLEKVDSEWLQKSIFKNLVSILGKDDSGVIYDATNTYLSGNNATLANKGKDKDGVRGRKLIQIGLGVTRTLGLPIFHHVHDGNIHDSKMFKEAIYHFRDLGIKKGVMVFDRGITSKDSVFKLSSYGWKVLAGVPMHKGIKSQISNLDLNKMQNFRNYLVQGETEFYVKSIKSSMGDCQGQLLILLNVQKKQALAKRRRKEINQTKQFIQSNKEIIDDNLRKFFNTKQGINHHAISRAEKYDGLSFLFTNAKFTIKQAVDMYFAKDLIEKCFRLEKSVLGLHPIRFWFDSKIKSHVLICHLGLALLTTVRSRLRAAGIKEEPDAVLRKLNTIYKINLLGVHRSSKRKIAFSKVNTLSNHQNDILKCISPKLEL